MTEPKTFHEKILAVQKAVHSLNLTPEGTGQVGSREYKYLTIQKLHAAVMPILFEHGLTWVTRPTVFTNGDPSLSYHLTDGKDRLEDAVPLLACSDMQNLGSAITYARRYCLLAVLGLTPDEDDDCQSKGTQSAPKANRPSVPTIPLDRARKVLEAAQKAGLASGTYLQPALVAKLTEVGVTTGKIGSCNVDQIEEVEDFIRKEAEEMLK